MGGPRETALACLVVARLVTDCGSNGLLTPEQRLARAQATRTWLSAATVPAAIRVALARLAEATGEHPTAVAAALESVIAVTANQLDQGARSELSRLTQAVAG